MTVLICCPDDTAAFSAAGRTVYAAPEQMRFAAAAQFVAGEIHETELLREIADKPTLAWRFGLKAQEESPQSVKQRASAIAKLLLSERTDCVVLCPPNFLHFLIRAFERNGCCIRRSGSGKPQPGERIRVTEKKDHCGGCRHNCLLANPGCGVGRDKASRGY